MSSSNEVIAVELPVTDYLYAESKADTLLRDAFFRFLCPECPPRKGDNITGLSAEIWREKLLAFAEAQGLPLGDGSQEEKYLQARDRIFGEPIAIEAGGALANSFDVLVKAQVNGLSVTDGRFITAVGEGISGKIFSKSLAGKLVSPEPRGFQLEAHVVPVEDNRILLSLPSVENPPSNYMSAEQLDVVGIDKRTKMAMLGGYMLYTGKYNEFLQAILAKVEASSSQIPERPTVVLTAAAQEIAASKDVAEGLRKAAEIAPVLVFSNAGEFRRLMGMDIEWRKPHEAKWWTDSSGQRLADCKTSNAADPNSEKGRAWLSEHGWRKLEGNDLENAKQSDAAYLADKREANRRAFAYAHERFCLGDIPATFVVTDGKKGVHVVSNDCISGTFLPPPPPHGVVNAVGGGDAFAGGYMVGYVQGLSIPECVELGFVCAGEVIGRNEARLFAKEVASERGLLAYLNPDNPMHEGILRKLGASLESPMEIERKFLVCGEEWKDAVLETCVIHQKYLPAFKSDEVRIQLKKVENQIVGSLVLPDGKQTSSFVVKPKAEAFWAEHLDLITDSDGNVSVGDRIEARVRYEDCNPFMTIKAITDSTHARFEMEFPLPTEAATALFERCAMGVSKIRHKVSANGNLWYVDVYTGANEGLVVAELELDRADQPFEKPVWVGEEISGRRYSNRVLAETPYTKGPMP